MQIANRPSVPSAGCGRTAVILPPRPFRQNLAVCRVTNTSDEIYKQQKIQPVDENEFIDVDEKQVHYPELGSLESRVSAFYLDELFANTGPDLQETAYWFHTPDEGWKQEPTRYKSAPQVPVTFADPSHEDWEAENRTPIEELEEGQVITGMITDIWLYHGCQIDFGNQYDGLVPLHEDDWMEPGVREALMPGDEVTVKIHKLRQPGLYRWPIQLQLLDPVQVAPVIMDPDSYQPPIHHGWTADQGWSIDDILAATGREYQPSNYLIPQDEAELAKEMQEAYGFDFENENRDDARNHMEERTTFQYSQQISHLAQQQDIRG